MLRMLVGACLPRDVSQILQVMCLSMQHHANISRSQTAVCFQATPSCIVEQARIGHGVAEAAEGEREKSYA
jgi:hypothetical protein